MAEEKKVPKVPDELTDKAPMPSLDKLAAATGTTLTAAQSAEVKDAQHPLRRSQTVKGYIVQRERVGDWPRSQRGPNGEWLPETIVTPAQMAAAVGIDKNTDRHIQRLVDNGSVVEIIE